MRWQFVLAIFPALMVGLAAASFARAWAWQENGATATLYNQAGDEVGTVRFTQADDLVQIWVEVADLPSGFHGFHVHTTGVWWLTALVATGCWGRARAIRESRPSPATRPETTTGRGSPRHPNLILILTDGAAT